MEVVVNVALLFERALEGYLILIVVACLSTWVAPFPPRSGPVYYIRRITDPYLNVFRNLLPFRSFGGMDFSPILAIILLSWVINLFARVAMM